MDAAQERDPELTPLEQFDRDLNGFLDFVEAHAEGYLAVVNARGREPRLQELVERRQQRRVDELVALAAALEGVSRETIRTPLLVAAIRGWLGFTEAVVTSWLSGREISRDDVHELLRSALLQVLESPRVRSG
jgi:hypothetical protein